MFGKVIAEVLRAIEDETISDSKRRTGDVGGTSQYKPKDGNPR